MLFEVSISLFQSDCDTSAMLCGSHNVLFHGMDHRESVRSRERTILNWSVPWNGCPKIDPFLAERINFFDPFPEARSRSGERGNGGMENPDVGACKGMHSS